MDWTNGGLKYSVPVPLTQLGRWSFIGPTLLTQLGMTYVYILCPSWTVVLPVIDFDCLQAVGYLASVAILWPFQRLKCYSL